MAKLDNLKITFDDEVLKQLLGKISNLESRIQFLEREKSQVKNNITVFAEPAREPLFGITGCDMAAPIGSL